MTISGDVLGSDWAAGGSPSAPSTIEGMQRVIAELAKEGKTVFLNSHLLQEVEGAALRRHPVGATAKGADGAELTGDVPGGHGRGKQEERDEYERAEPGEERAAVR